MIDAKHTWTELHQKIQSYAKATGKSPHKDQVMLAMCAETFSALVADTYGFTIDPAEMTVAEMPVLLAPGVPSGLIGFVLMPGHRFFTPAKMSYGEWKKSLPPYGEWKKTMPKLIETDNNNVITTIGSNHNVITISGWTPSDPPGQILEEMTTDKKDDLPW